MDILYWYFNIFKRIKRLKNGEILSAFIIVGITSLIIILK